MMLIKKPDYSSNMKEEGKVLLKKGDNNRVKRWKINHSRL